VLLGRSATFLPWLRWVVLALGVVATVGLLVPAGWRARVSAVVVGAALLTGLAGPTAYAVQTTATAHQGSIPTAGPSTGTGFGPGGGRRGRFGDAGQPGAGGATPPGAPDAGATTPGAVDGAQPGAAAPGQAGGAGGPGGFGMGGPGGAEQVSTELADMLKSAGTRWAAATMGSQGASSMMLSTETAVMAIGGFSGGDPSPTLEQFQTYVANGEIHYFVSGGMGSVPGRGNSEITQWVQQHFTAQTVGNQTVYDLTKPTS
jgi:hypothetical protein